MTAEPKLMSADELADIELDLFAPGPGRLQIRQLLAHIAAQEQRIAELAAAARHWHAKYDEVAREAYGP